MKHHHVSVLLSILLFLGLSSGCRSQVNPKPENATVAVLRAFETHDIVLFGEWHDNKQEYEWLRSLVATPEFADRIDDIVMEFGNSLYQKSVDDYVSGKDVPLEKVQKAWLNVAGVVGPPSPVYASLYQAVRETNLKRPSKHQMRVLCGDPYADWDKIENMEDLEPFLSNREQWYAQVVKDQVLSKHHRALLIMGSGHFLRALAPPPGGSHPIEPQLRLAGAKTYVIVAGTNTIGSYDDFDPRFDSWPAPVIVSLAGNWVGELSGMPVVFGGAPLFMVRSGSGPVAAPPPPSFKLKDAADALLYLGPRDSLTAVHMPRAELDGTPYGKEIQRRLKIEELPLSFGESDSDESRQFSRPKPPVSAAPPPPPPPPPQLPKNMGAPLPPRPPSQ